MHPFDYVVHETERQSGTMREAVGMYRAWQMFDTQWKNGYRLNGTTILSAAGLINNSKGYRKVPAVFNQGMPAVPPGEQLERAMQRWNDVINSGQVDAANKYQRLFERPRDIADYVTREFLLIHPFADGNGRVGSLVWNFLNESITSPEPMPYFFGENNG